MATRLTLLDASFPGRPAFDTAVSRAVLRDVAHGKRGETLRLYVPDDVLAFSTTDLRRPGFSDAVRAARSAGFDAALRLAGGSAAVFTRQTLAFAWCTPEREPRAGIHARFEKVAGWIARALGSLGVDARVGEVPGAYCPGDYSVNARGAVKLMGVGQRIVQGAAHTGGVLVVAGADRIREPLVPVYDALDYDYDPTTTGAVEDEVAGVGVAEVRAALLAALAEGASADYELEDGVLTPDTLEQAARYETSHTLPEIPPADAKGADAG
ncbi:MAG: lipoate--protein ligase family protein [Myxococcota bacterium]